MPWQGEPRVAWKRPLPVMWILSAVPEWRYQPESGPHAVLTPNHRRRVKLMVAGAGIRLPFISTMLHLAVVRPGSAARAAGVNAANANSAAPAYAVSSFTRASLLLVDAKPQGLEMERCFRSRSNNASGSVTGSEHCGPRQA